MFYSNLFQYLKQLMTLIVAIDVEQMKSFSSKNQREIVSNAGAKWKKRSNVQS